MATRSRISKAAGLVRKDHSAQVSIGSAKRRHSDRKASVSLGGHDWRTQDATRCRRNRRDAQRNRAYHGRNHRRMQLYVTLCTKAAARFRLTRWLRAGHAFEHLLNLPPDSRFQYGNANQFPVGCRLALISRHLIFRHPPTSHGAHQKECL